MRTTLDVENDVLDAARALAVARGVSVGAAFVGTGAAGCRGPNAVERPQRFSGISSTVETPGFGPDEVRAAASREDLEAAREFLEPGR